MLAAHEAKIDRKSEALTRHKRILWSFPLPQNEANRDNHTNHHGGDDLYGIPRVFATSPSHAQNEDGHAGKCQEDSAEINSL